MISQLKGVAKVGKDPIPEETPTLSTSGGRRPTSNSEGVLLCFDVAPYPCPCPPS